MERAHERCFRCIIWPSTRHANHAASDPSVYTTGKHIALGVSTQVPWEFDRSTQGPEYRALVRYYISLDAPTARSTSVANPGTRCSASARIHAPFCAQPRTAWSGR